MNGYQAVRIPLAAVAAMMAATASWGQVAPGATPESPPDDEVIVLSPFEVSAEAQSGYAAATTLAGNRLNTDLRDIGNAVSVITSQFLQDVGATNNETLLQYTTGTEVGAAYGNFAGLGDGANLDESGGGGTATRFINPSSNTRVRGLTSADNTRDFFITDIPWEGYNVDRVDMQRGANSILFGQGSPAGIINTASKQAGFKDSNQVTARYGSFGSTRGTIDINRVLIKGELAIRFSALYNDEKFKQEPAFSRDRRLYGALRWEPAFLKRGGARTILKANYEVGNVRSNRPRVVPPIDNITPWFYTGTYAGRNATNADTTYAGLNRETFIPSQLQDDNTGRPNHGQMRATWNFAPVSGNPNPYFQPWLGNFGQQFGGPLAFFDATSNAPASYRVYEPTFNFGLNSAGAIDRSVGGMPYQRPTSIAPYDQFARQARLPFYEFGIYKQRSLTDATVFDFYNNLLDGPNKREWQDFRHYTISLAQTFFDDRLGFDISYNKEDYKNGQLSLLSAGRQAIYIDINRVYGDGTPAGRDGEPFADGTPNPNVGRAFVSDDGQGGNNSYHSTWENARLTAFATHDFTRGGNRNWVTRALGQHTLTALLGKDRQTTDNRGWIQYATDDVYREFVNLPDVNAKFNNGAFVPSTVIYLGPSLISRNSASGAFLPRPQNISTPRSGTVRTFDSHWNRSTVPGNANYVDPAAAWNNEYYTPNNLRDGTPVGAYVSTQSENPGNYVGWRDVPMRLYQSEQGYRDYLTTAARLTKSTVSSKVAVWQAKFWDNALVGTYGVRKDVAKSWQHSQDLNSASSDRYGHLNLGSDVYRLNDDYDTRLDITSRSWSAVAHLTQFIGDRSPVRVSLYYSKSENFQPAANRVDVYGVAIGAPSGETTDKGILLETRDGKYSFKINKYETKSLNQTSTSLTNTWFIGASQVWSGNWVNIFEYDIRDGNNITGRDANPSPTNTRYNYGQAPGETLEDAQAREARVIAAWRTWQRSVDPRFYAAWQINLNDNTRDITSTNPNGFSVTEDSISKGYEFEFSALPTKNWRVTLNATKTEAVRTNIGGTNLTGFINAYETALRTTPAGDLRIWWGGAGNETALFQWNNNVGSEYAQRRLQEGTNAPELREWRFNAVSNYDFDEGRLKGFNVGVGVRYESDIVIGYRPIPSTVQGQANFDLANPFKGPAETNWDFWLGYTRKLTRNIDWQIQLNVRNAFVGDELIPVTTQPDGSPAGFRIRPPQTWTLTNTLNF
ncbi:TonB-dependent receptor plug domain-containing protein [Opitutus terrae]|uniref:TonB-dependent receptor plug n=1 Tax=Opitutus terrae (strain DSM 11246 / JCM 15787 / PB90-1) TaxID=452637 RepID=B1ZYN8_OPITP|nr:TonB-dependent receptor plug domain-containing protein [Opitutus terrae]ACB75274.1 TonB-dependent receptor plug [Opitutus terrae PB90-1]